jgi:hypothetical protein
MRPKRLTIEVITERGIERETIAIHTYDIHEIGETSLNIRTTSK